MFDLTSEKCTTLTGLYQFKNEETNKSNFQECENKRVSHVSIRTRRGVVASVYVRILILSGCVEEVI